MNIRVYNALDKVASLDKEARVGKFTRLGRKLGLLKMPKGGLGVHNLSKILPDDQFTKLWNDRKLARLETNSKLDSLLSRRNFDPGWRAATGWGTPSDGFKRYSDFEQAVRDAVSARSSGLISSVDKLQANKKVSKLFSNDGVRSAFAIPKDIDLAFARKLMWPSNKVVADYFKQARDTLRSATHAGDLTKQIKKLLDSLR